MIRKKNEVIIFLYIRYALASIAYYIGKNSNELLSNVIIIINHSHNGSVCLTIVEMKCHRNLNK